MRFCLFEQGTFSVYIIISTKGSHVSLFLKIKKNLSRKTSQNVADKSNSFHIYLFQQSMWNFFFFFNCYLVVPRPTLGHSQGDSLTNPMLITAFVHIRPEGHREPRNEVGSLSPAERLAGFEPGTFQFLLQRLNPLGHSPQKN